MKVGRNPSGSQRYLCAHFQRKYTPHLQPQGYDEALRRQAVCLDVDGMNLRRIARHLGVVHQTVANWVAAYAATLSETPPLPASDRQPPCRSWSWMNSTPSRGRKNRVYLITQVDRATRCIIAYDVASDRTPDRLQALLNTVPSAEQY